MVIQLRDLEDWFVQDLKQLTGQSTASKAFVAAGAAYSEHQEIIAELELEVAQLKERCGVQQQVIERARDSAAALLDHVAQGDLLDAQ